MIDPIVGILTHTVVYSICLYIDASIRVVELSNESTVLYQEKVEYR